MQRSLVSFIDYHDRVRVQIRFNHKLSQQHTISHVLDKCTLIGVVLKPDRIAHLLTNFDIHLFSYSGSHAHCCYSSWLSATNFFVTPSISDLVQVLWKLGCFSRACLSNHNYYLLSQISDNNSPLYLYIGKDSFVFCIAVSGTSTILAFVVYFPD